MKARSAAVEDGFRPSPMAGSVALSLLLYYIIDAFVGRRGGTCRAGLCRRRLWLPALFLGLEAALAVAKPF
ncbi:MAG: hypothetical protein PHV13_03915 [Candidatus ainarchaeum sp.]|nr:hypothetical protein [Candidatus ainarchaeum sp.]